MVTLNAKDDEADLIGWVTIDNHGGASWKGGPVFWHAVSAFSDGSVP
ncbi:MAG TPA: hypothetical protein VL122_02185 [Nitrospirota bacterium]|nr:hypothetical protein [Nitrospirota bacterium]